MNDDLERANLNSDIVNDFNLARLIPDFSSLNIFSPTTADQLNSADQLVAYFVTFLLLVFLGFLIKSFLALHNSLRQTSWLSNLIKNESQSTIAMNRAELSAKAKIVEKENNAGHLWLEFNESLVEVKDGDNIQLKNTIDSHHFFNSSTLAAGITESRMLAAVPGFLTAVGVIGTFVGLQLGLSGLHLEDGFTIAQMKAGISHVISGATIAFMSSVWGVTLSVLFNFIEKFLESKARNKIHKLQIKIDNLFLRLNAESELVRIADSGDQSRESLQGLAEQIGEKMQESLLEATAGIQSGLESSLEKIMAPAINKLVNETSDGNQKALESLVDNFLEQFGKQGDQQRESMNLASNNVNEAIGSLSASMNTFIEKLGESQNNSDDREKELITTISTQVSQLIDHSVEQKLIITDFVEKQLGGLSDIFNEREQLSVDRDEKRQNMFIAQTSVMKQSTERLLNNIEESMGAQSKSTEILINQGRSLQDNVSASIDANVEASTNLQISANELNKASQEMRAFGYQVKDAGIKLSDAISNAVESTSDLARQNVMATELIGKHRQQLFDDKEQFSHVIQQLQSLVNSVDSSFDKMTDHQNTYLIGLKSNVSDLADQMTKLLRDYADQANSQTTRHLNAWAEHTTNYAAKMNSAAIALANVVEDIEDMLGE